MDILITLWDLLVHLDRYLGGLIRDHGTWVYLILFAIIFCETGLVVTPFLPGDSLLFVAGTLWASAGMDINVLILVLSAAALTGDNCNYWIGRFLGPRVFRWENSRIFSRRALDRTSAFYARHGGRTVIIARYVPIVRTFAPFVAGIGHMAYPRFLAFSIGGALLWVTVISYAGYFFGNIPAVRQNLTLVIFGIIAISMLPVISTLLRERLRRA